MEQGFATARKRRKILGFTLVELIVVITILSILGTIGFLSIQWYSGNARDGSRLSDLSNLSKSLELYQIRTGSYPSPDNAFNVTYSGGTLWSQWSAGDGLMTALSLWSPLNKKPLDPLLNKEYSYSLSSKEYQIKADFEGVVALSPFVQQAYAATGNPTVSRVFGKYNGVVSKTSTGGMVYMVAVPSIMTSYSAASGASVDVTSTLANKLVVNGWSNTWETYAAKLAFASDSVPTYDEDKQAFASWVVLAYTWTSLASKPEIAPYMTAYANNDSTTLSSLGKTFVCSAYGACTGGSACAPYSASKTYTAGKCFTYNGATITVTATGIGTSSSTHGSCSSPDVAIWTNGAAAPQVWALCNVGATTAYAWWATNEWNSWKFFQAWEDVAWDFSSSVGPVNNCSWNRDTQSCGASAVGTWQTSVSDTASNWTDRWSDWGWSTRWPCMSGYHVPSKAEWTTANSIISNRNTFYNTLKTPLSGGRGNSNGVMFSAWSYWYYWTSSPSGTNNYFFWIDSWFTYPSSGYQRTYGFHVRCLKD